MLEIWLLVSMNDMVKFYECLYSVKESVKDESDSVIIKKNPTN